MTKQKFKPYKLEDLTGWINTRDYPSEIEDKQSIDLNNWNFKGNKLVSGFWIANEHTWHSPYWPICWLTVDWKDKWYIQNWNLYKNWNIQFWTYIYELVFPTITDTVVWSITVDWNNRTFYSYSNSNLKVFFQQFIEWIWYNFSDSWNNTYKIWKNDFSQITITRPNLSKKVTIPWWEGGWWSGAFASLTLDWTTATANQLTYSLSDDALSYIYQQYSISTYHKVITVNSPWGFNDYFVIARNDSTALSITTSWNISVVDNSEIWITINQVWLWIEVYDRYNLAVSSYWILLTWHRAFDPVFVDLTNKSVTTISGTAVWNPTLWIIYNWKIILGWYKWKDNIVFSKTEDPVTTANELIDFSGYSSGWQSVSGWNKGEIKGFIVGENWLYVFKENEVWYSNSEKDTWTSFNFVFKKITSTGASWQNAICEVEQEIFYFDYINRAVRRLWYEKDLTTLRDVAVSREIEDILAEIPEDHEWNNERFSNLINLSYKYPYLELNYPDSSAPYVYYNLADEDQKYRIPNKTLVYNTENKSWSKRSDKEYTNKYALHSHKGYYWTQNWNIYSSVSSNTSENWDSLSKEYTYWDDSAYKKIWRFDVVGKIIPDSWQSKTLTIKILLDDVEIDERVITATTTQRVIERIDLYDIWKRLQFKLQHSWSGRVEIYDVTPYIKGTNIQTDY
jgi:hypothetical protein